MRPLWHPPSFRGILWLLTLLSVFVLWSPEQAEASHFRGGDLYYEITSGRTARFTVDAYIRIGSGGGNGTLYFGDGKSQYFNPSSSRNQYLRRSIVSHTYSRDGTFTANWGSCCWISGISNRSSSWNHSIKVRIYSGHKGGPYFASPTFFQICYGAKWTGNMNGIDREKGGTVSYKLSSAPSGMTVNSSTGVISWPSPVRSPNKHVFTLIGTSSKSSATAFREVMVEVTGTCASNKTPVISVSPTTFSGKAGSTACTKVTASDPDGRITFQVTPAKPGATATPSGSYSSHTWTYCWPTKTTDEGTTTGILFTVTDNGNPKKNAQAKFTVVLAQGGTPNITVSPSGTTKTVNEGSSVSFSVSASDNESSIQSFTVSGRPSFCTQSPSSSTSKYSFTCKPGYTHGTKDYKLTFTAKDRDRNVKTSTLVVTIRVNNVNRKPTITGPASSYTIKEGQNLRFTATISDADGNLDSRYYSCSKPSGASCTLGGSGNSSRTYSFNWTPSYSQSGTHKVTISARDTSGATVSKTITITVTNVNRAPTISNPGNKSVKENSRLSFTATASDPDGNLNTGTFSCSRPSGASCTLGGSGNSSRTINFSWTPTYSQSGSYKVTFSIKDTNGVTATRSITITVSNVNRVPTWSGSTSYSVTEGSNLKFTLTATDPDGNAITPSNGSVPSGASKVVYGGSGSKRTYTFNWTPNHSQSGRYTVTFTARDSLGATSSRTVTITVNNKNRAPVLSGPTSVGCTENKACSFKMTASDPDGNSIRSFTYTTLPSGSRISSSGNTRTFSWTPSFTQAGTYTITFTAVDSGSPNLSVKRTVTIKVGNANRAPTVSGYSSSYSIKENQSFSFRVTATDPDGNLSSIVWTTKAPSGASQTVSGSGNTRYANFSWRPSYTQAGTYRVSFTAKDSNGAATSRTVTITVTNINRNPVLSNPGSKSVSEGKHLSFSISASDPDGNAIAWNTTTGIPSGARVTGSGNSRTFSWTPNFSQAGRYTVTFNISDSEGGRASRSVAITVGNANRAPILSNPGSKSISEGSSLTFSISASDPDGNAITWNTTTGVPSGARITGSGNSRTFSWTPNFSQAGKYTVTFNIKDSLGATASRSVSITVGNKNRTPTISNPGSRTVAEGKHLSFSLSASDPDGNSLTWTTSGVPSGAKVTGSGNNRTFSWTPSFSQAGKYSVRFTVTDNGSPNLSYTRTVTITVTNTNRAPVLSNPGNKSVAEGSTLTFSISASDPDGNAITWSTTTGVPSGARITGSGNSRTFSWTPNFSQAGKYAVTFNIKDSLGATASRSVSITVGEKNRGPSISNPGNKSVSEGKSLSFGISASDPDGHTLTWSTSGMPNGATFSTSGNSRTFSWTPNFSQAGTYKVTFTVKDNGIPSLSASRTVTITVSNVNRAPTLSNPGNKTISEGQALSLTFTGSDPDGNSLKWSITGTPSGATFSGSGSTGTFKWTPGFTQAGSYRITVTVTDNGSPNRATSRTITITVTNKNRTPVLSNPGNQSGAEGKAMTFAVTGSDPDGNALTWKYSGVPTGAKIIGSGNTKTFSWTPGFSAAGTYKVTFTATDNGSPNLATSRTITISIGNNNRAPKLTGPATMSGSENKAMTFVVTGSDPDGNALTWKYSGVPSGAKVTGSGNTKTFSWTPTYNQAGSYKVTFTATDNGSPALSATLSVTIRIANTNRAPALSNPGNKTIAENSKLSFGISASDPDGNAIKWSTSTLPPGATFSGGATTGSFSWTPTYSQSGSYKVTFTVTDNGSPNLSTSRSITITVTNKNRAPVLSNPGSKSVAEGQPLAFTVTGSDPDGNALSWKYSGVPSGARITGTGNTKTFSWTPGFSAAGTYKVTFTATDNGSPNLATSRTVTIAVGNNNRTPKVTGPSTVSGSENKALSFTVIGSDPDGNALTWKYSGVPSGAKVTGSGNTKTFSWTPTYNQAGSYKVTFTATDNGSPALSASLTVTVTIGNVNRRPVFAKIPTSYTVAESKRLSFTLSASDPDGNAISWSNTTLPSGASFSNSGNTRTFNWTPSYTQAGKYTITFNIKDNGSPSLSSGITIAITVTNTNRAPSLSNPGNKSVAEGQLVTFVINASDPDGNTLSWKVTGTPSGANISGTGNSRTFTWTPNFSQAGTYNVTFTVSDGSLSATRTVTIVVGNKNLVPKLSGPTTVSGQETKALSFTVTGSDPDGNKLTWKYTNIPTGAKVTGSGNTKTFSWTPSYAQSGTYKVTFSVTDDGTPNLSASRTVTISIGNVNRKPVFAKIPTSYTVAESKRLSFSLSASDPDGDAISWSNTTLPSGASFSNSGNNRTFNWTPSYTQAGKYTITFNIKDNGSPSLSSSITIAITVTNTNRAPIISGSTSYSTSEGKTLSFTLTATDPDAGNLLFYAHQTALPLPSGAKYSVSGDGTSRATYNFTWTPSYSQAGGYEFYVGFNDDLGMLTRVKIKIVVGNNNRTPSLKAPTTVSGSENKALSFTVIGSDPDGNALTWKYTNIPTGAKVTGSGNTKTFSWTPSYAQSGTYKVTFSVTDDGTPNLSASRTVTISIGNVNRKPVFASSPSSYTVAETKLLSFTVSASDPDGNAIGWSNTTLPSGATLSGTGNARTFNWTPTYTQAGKYTISFTIKDNGSPSLSATRMITITVLDTNRNPIISGRTSYNTSEGKPLSFTLTATDPDGDKVAYSHVTSPALPGGAKYVIGANTTPKATYNFSWTPSYTQAGKYEFFVRFVDSNGGSVQVKVTVVVGNNNRAPVLSNPGNKSVSEGKALSFNISGSDPDGNNLTWSVTGTPAGAFVSGTGNSRTFRWTPNYKQSGTYRVIFKVTDDGSPALSASRTVTITVGNVNRAPSLTDPGNKTVAENSTLTFTITGQDPDSDKLTWSYSTLPKGASISSSGDVKTLTWKPGYTQAGKYTITFSIKDDGSPSLGATRTVSITVTNTNRPPMLTNPGPQATTENKALTFTITGSDPDGNGLTWKYSGVPAGAKITGTGNTKTFSWTPSFSQGGNYTVVFAVADNGSPSLNASRSVSIVVGNTNRAPKLTDPGAQKVDESKKLVFTITGSDPDNNKLAWTFSGVPTGAKVTGTSDVKTFTWTPSYTQAGTYKVTFSIKDNGSPSLGASRTVVITVGNTNRAPKLTNPGAKTVNEESTLTFTISGSDPDGNKLTWKYTGVPKGATVTGKGDVKTFTWKPTYSQSGKFSVTFDITDDGKPNLSASVTVEITVTNVNRAPVLTDPGAQFVAENSTLTFTITGSDPDNNKLTWKYTGLPKGGAITGSGDTKTFNWTPGFSAAGSYTVTFVVTDDNSPSLSATRKVVITVGNTNRAPGIADPGAQKVDENKTLTFKLSGSDPDGNKLNWTTKNLPVGATFNGVGNTGTFTWKPTFEQAGKYKVTFTVTDDGKPQLDNSIDVTITVNNVNRNPLIKAPATQGVNEGSKLVFTVEGIDPDRNKLTWSYTGLPKGAAVTGKGDIKTFTWTPGFSASGKYTVTFTITDDGTPKLTATHKVLITVGNKNRGPSLTDPGVQTIDEGKSLSFTISGTDPDGNALNWQYNGIPKGASISGSGDTKTFNWVPGYTQAGTYKVRFTVLDNGTPQLGAAREVTITVNNINRRPMITDPGAQKVSENKSLSFSVTGSDPDNNKLTWKITGIPTGARVAGTGDKRTFTWTPGFTQAGTYTVVFAVTDDGKPNLSYSRSVKITVNNINRAPSLTDPGAQRVNEDKLLTFKLKGSDPDGNNLTWKITGTPSGAKISTGATNERVFEWKPTFSQAGSYKVTFEISDDGIPSLKATRTVTITVTNVNRVPRLTDPGAQSVAENKTLTFSISGSDPDGNKLTWATSGVPTGAKVSGSGNTRTFSWTPTFKQSGRFNVTFTVIDDGAPNLKATRTVSIQVTNVNLAPKLTNPGAQKVAENSKLTFTVNGSDPDNNALTWKVTGTPRGANVTATSTSRTFNWTPGFEQAGSYTVTFEVVDSGTPALSDKITVTITVTNVNRTPKITSLPPTVATEDRQYTYNASASDPDLGAVLTWSLLKGPKGTTLNSSSGSVNWKPGNADAEKSFDFEIKVCDKLGLCDTQKWTVKVINVNDPPVITTKASQAATEDKRYTYTPKFTDPDPGDSHTWSFLQGPKEMNMDPKTGFLFWTPSDRDAGQTVSVSIRVCDKAGACDTQSWNIKVGTVNDAPKITSIPPTVALESKLYSYAAKFKDPDTGDSHTWKLLKGAPGSRISATGVVTWTSKTSDANKSYSFEVQVCDKAGACDKQAWRVTVKNTNNPPKITSTPGITATEDKLYSYAAKATDPDPSDPTVWTLSNGPSNAKMNANTGLLTWTPGKDAAGKSISFEIKACDQAGVCDTQKWSVRVKNVNDAPKITSTPPSTTREKAGYTYKAEARDADTGDILTWRLVNGPRGAVIDSNSGILRWQPGQQDAGKTYTFEIEVCDLAKACDKQSWPLRVINDNDAPTITSTPVKTATEDQLYVYNATATDPDPKDTLRWKLLRGPQGSTMNPGTGKLEWKPADKDANKDVDFEIEVCDNDNNCDTQSWTVRVSNVNDAPKITSTPNTDAVEDRLYGYSPVFSDSDANDTHTWRLLKGPKGTKIDAKTGEIEWTPGAADAGKSFDVEIEVCDQDRDCDTQKWTVKVKNVNGAPSITSKPPTTADENKLYSYTPKAEDSDPNDVLTWKAKELPTGAKMDSKTGKVTWTPGVKEAGKTYDFELEVCDKDGQCDTQRWQVSVTNKNDPPRISGKPEDTGYVGQKWVYEPVVDDNDPSDTHSWGFKKAPAGALIDRQTGKITWTPVNADANKTFDFEIEVCDDGKPISCARQSFKVKVIKTCLTDANCPEDRLCQDRKCVDVECSAKKPCKSGEFCLLGKCKQDPCKTISCQKDQICRPTDGKCIYPCSGVTCSQGQVCKDGKCEADPCAATPCQKGEICDTRTDPSNPTCIKNPCDSTTCKNGRVCDQDGNCVDDPCSRMKCPGKGQRCVAGQCVDRLPCNVDSDCPSDDVCLEGRCTLPGCYKGTTCAKDEFCVAGACTTDPCLDKNGRGKCGTDEFCRRSDGKCAKSCSGSSCTKGELCVDGVCIADPCSTVTCAAGKLCIAGKCENDNCNASGTCKHKRVCNPLSNRCGDDPCAGVKCPSSKEVCKDGQCVPPPSCNVDSDCPADRLCQGGECKEPLCKEDGDCQSNEACVNGECKADLCKNKKCDKGQFCRAGQCYSSCSGVYCKDNEQCVNGQCVTDPCANVKCPFGKKCFNGTCRDDKCTSSSCKAGRVCQIDRCVTDPCAGVKCPDGEACSNGQCGGNRVCKYDRDCPGSAICVNSKCVSATCNTAGCKDAELCYDGKCVSDLCVNRNCAEDEFCNPSDGKCVKSCPTCPNGETCKEGSCVKSACPTDGCPDGERCIKGECRKDECLGAGANICKYQRQCFDNRCQDDPCAGIKCADGQTCREGVCYGKPKATETPKEAIVSEPSDENVNDGGADATVDAGNKDKKSGGNGKDGDIVEIPEPPGCSCSTTEVPGGLSFFLLFFVALLSFRRRRR